MEFSSHSFKCNDFIAADGRGGKIPRRLPGLWEPEPIRHGGTGNVLPVGAGTSTQAAGRCCKIQSR